MVNVLSRRALLARLFLCSRRLAFGRPVFFAFRAIFAFAAPDQLSLFA
jgi:hypothetical protein